MNPCLPEIRVGTPIHCEGLAVFPLYAERSLFADSGPEYVLSHEAMAAGTVTVREVSEAGVVSELTVENAGDLPCLILEGTELRGSKQARMLKATVLVGAESGTNIPVSCVERGRWAYSSQNFAPGSCCPPSLRRLLKQAASAAGSSRLVGQASLWQAIRRKHMATATRSERENLTDTLETHREAAEDMRGRLVCPEGASGIAVALGGKVVCLDVFDKPATLMKLWDRLVDGLVLDALEFRDAGRQADANDISVKLYQIREAGWRQVATVGLGEAYRAIGVDGTLATAVVVDGTLLHFSLSMPA